MSKLNRGIDFLNYILKHTKKDDPLREVLDSPVGKKRKAISVVDKPKEGGILTYFSGAKLPFRGFPDREYVNEIATMKKFIPMGIKWMWRVVEEMVPINPRELSQPVREIWRLCTLLAEREESSAMQGKWEAVRGIVCMILEYDDAYRFRFQDIATEVKLDELKLSEEDKYWFKDKAYKWRGREETRERYKDEAQPNWDSDWHRKEEEKALKKRLAEIEKERNGQKENS